MATNDKVSVTGFASKPVFGPFPVGYDDAYFNGTVTDPNAVWTNDANIADNSLSTYASATTTSTQASGYIKIAGNTHASAPTTYSRVDGFWVRAYGYKGDANSINVLLGLYNSSDTQIGLSINTADYFTTTPGWGAWLYASAGDGELLVADVNGISTRVSWSGTTSMIAIAKVEIRLWHNRADSLYVVGLDSGGSDLRVNRSTDGGGTWSEADSANVPTLSTPQTVTATYNGGFIYVMTQDNYTAPVGMTAGSMDIEFHRFECLGNTWDIKNENADTISLSTSISTYREGGIAPVHNGEPVIVYYGDSYTNMGSDYLDAHYAYRGKGGGWSPGITLTTQDAATGKGPAGPWSVMTGRRSVDTVYLLYNNGNFLKIRTRTDGTLNAEVSYTGSWTFSAGGFLDAAKIGAQLRVFSSPPHVQTSGFYDHLDGSPITNINGGTSRTIKSNTVRTQVYAGAWDEVNDDFYVAWCYGSTNDNDIYIDVSTDNTATWGTDTLVEAIGDAFDYKPRGGRIYYHTSGNGGAYVFGYLVQRDNSGTLYYDEYVISGGGTVYNDTLSASITATVTGTDDHVGDENASASIVATVDQTDTAVFSETLTTSITSTTTMVDTKPVFETLAVSIVATTTAADSAVLADAATVSIVATTTMADSITQSDALTASIVSTTTMTDSLVAADAATVSIVATTTMVDGPAFQETLTTNVTATTTASDTLVGAETRTTSIVATTTTTDAATLADTLAVSIVSTTTMVDNTVLADALTTSIVATTTLVDGQFWADALTAAITATVTQTDNAVFADALTVPIVATTTLVDGQPWSDTLAVAITATTTLLDEIVWTEALSAAIVATTTTVDALVGTEATTTSIIATTTLVDGLFWNEALTAAIVATTAITDAQIGAETLVTSIVSSTTLVDAFTWTEALSAAIVATTTLADAATFADALTTSIVATTTMVDSLGGQFFETLSVSIVATTAASDALVAAETLSVPVTLTTTENDAQIGAEGLSAPIVATVTQLDTLIMTEAAAANIIATVTQAETAAYAETLSTSMVYTSTMIDGYITTEAHQILIDSLITANDIYIPVGGLPPAPHPAPTQVRHPGRPDIAHRSISRSRNVM